MIFLTDDVALNLFAGRGGECFPDMDFLFRVACGKPKFLPLQQCSAELLSEIAVTCQMHDRIPYYKLRYFCEVLWHPARTRFSAFQLIVDNAVRTIHLHVQP
jgi:hypothetical protein